MSLSTPLAHNPRIMGFAADLAKFAEKTKERIDDVHREMVIQIANSLITGSAVDTGRFRANWVPGINQVNTATTTSTDNTALGTISAAVPKPGGVFYITNSLPYAHRLEYEGWSKQMPAGVVRVTAMRFNEWLAKAIATT